MRASPTDLAVTRKNVSMPFAGFHTALWTARQVGRPLAIAACSHTRAQTTAAAVLHEPRWAALGIALVAWAFATGWLRALAATLVAASTLAFVLWLAAHLPGMLLYVPPVAINLALCTLFARTLRQGCEPLVSHFARIGRGGQLAPDLARYTRNLTRAWAGFFVLMRRFSTAVTVRLRRVSVQQFRTICWCAVLPS